MSQSTDWANVAVNSTSWFAGDAFTNDSFLQEDGTSLYLLENGSFAYGMESGGFN